MKRLFFTLMAAGTLLSAQSQTVYNITSDTKTNSNPFPSPCTNCQINLSDGVTLTVNTNIFLSNSHFTGGTIIVKNSDVTFWSTGSFNNTKVSFTNNASLVTSSQVTLNNLEVTFNNNSRGTIYSSFQLNSSKVRLLDNSRIEATGGNFEVKNNSKIIVGDGSTGSLSYIKFNGATLYQYDQSFITLGNFNNYYFNWSSYNSVPNNTSYSILNNNLNCGPGKNPCSNPNLYGPSTLSVNGFSTSAMLPVKLSDFSLRASQTSVLVKWRTEMEQNADHFVIQRSTDGVYWQTAGEVKATGNSAVPVEYSFNDTRPGSPMLYYRLKMVDIDKYFEFSPIKNTTLGVENQLVIYPNPAKDYFNILAAESADLIQGMLLSDHGSVIKKFEGKSQVRVELSGVPPGSYFIKVTTDTIEYRNFKLIINR